MRIYCTLVPSTERHMAIVFDLGTNTRVVPLDGDVARGLAGKTAQVCHYFLAGNRRFSEEFADGVCVGFDDLGVVYTHPDLAKHLGHWIEVTCGDGNAIITRTKMPLPSLPCVRPRN